MDLSFLSEGWNLFKRTWKAALGLWGLYLLVVGVPAVVALRPLFAALETGPQVPPAPGPLFFVVIILNFLLAPAMYWATMVIASAPGAGEEPRVIPSLKEGFRHWWQAAGLGLLIAVGSSVPLLILGPVLNVLGFVGGLLQAVYSGIVLVYAEFALLGLVRVPWMGVFDAVKGAGRVVPKSRWTRTVGVLVLLGLAAQLLTGLLSLATWRLTGQPWPPPQAEAPPPGLFWWVFVANLPLVVFSWYQLLCAVSLWWRCEGLKAVTGAAPGSP